MRPALRTFLAVVSAAAALGTFSGPSRAACAAPDVRVARVAGPGDSLTVRGNNWATECNDVIACSVGCLGKQTCSGGETSPPARSLRIVLETAQGRSRIELASGVDASSATFAVKYDVTLPDDLEPGRYQVLLGSKVAGWHRSNVIEVQRAP